MVNRYDPRTIIGNENTPADDLYPPWHGYWKEGTAGPVNQLSVSDILLSVQDGSLSLAEAIPALRNEVTSTMSEEGAAAPEIEAEVQYYINEANRIFDTNITANRGDEPEVTPEPYATGHIYDWEPETWEAERQRDFEPEQEQEQVIVTDDGDDDNLYYDDPSGIENLEDHMAEGWGTGGLLEEEAFGPFDRSLIPQFRQFRGWLDPRIEKAGPISGLYQNFLQNRYAPLSRQFELGQHRGLFPETFPRAEREQEIKSPFEKFLESGATYQNPEERKEWLGLAINDPEQNLLKSINREERETPSSETAFDLGWGAVEQDYPIALRPTAKEVKRNEFLRWKSDNPRASWLRGFADSGFKSFYPTATFGYPNRNPLMAGSTASSSPSATSEEMIPVR